jgi:hypothetical protein
MNKAARILVGACVVAVAIAHVGIAQDDTGEGKPERGRRQGQGRMRFRAMDTDQNGEVSYEEFKTHFEQKLAERFERMDRNGDGVLSPEDRRQRPEGEPGDGQGRRRRGGPRRGQDGGGDEPAL